MYCGGRVDLPAWSVAITAAIPQGKSDTDPDLDLDDTNVDHQ
jgi:hypothetical protein